MAWLILASALLGPVAARSEAWAQSKEATSQTSDEAARFYAAGVKAAEAGEWEKARSAFSEAWTRKRHVKIAAHLGRADLKTGRYRDAAEHLSYSLQNAQDIDEEHRKDLHEMLTQALARVAVVTMRVNVEGAEVLIDGKWVGRAPISGPVYVNPGRRRFEANLPGYLAKVKTLEMSAGGALTVELSLVRETASVTGADDSMRASPEGGISNASAMATGSREGFYKGILVAGTAVSTGLTIAGVGFLTASQVTLRSMWEQGSAATEELRSRQSMQANSAFYFAIGAGASWAATVGYSIWGAPEKPHSAAALGIRPGHQEFAVVLHGTW